MSRAFCAVRIARPMMTPLAWLTLAIGSPVMKCLTSSTSSDSYGLPQRRTGIFRGLATGGFQQESERLFEQVLYPGDPELETAGATRLVNADRRLCRNSAPG